MGVEERMADRCNTIRLYSFQTDVVYQVLKRDGVCYSKEEYVRKKYKESAKVFINAYGWFVKEAQHIVPKPEGIHTGHSQIFIMWIRQEMDMC